MFPGHLARNFALRAGATGDKGDLDAFKKHVLDAVQFEGSPPALRLNFAHQAVTASLPESDPAWKDMIVSMGLDLLNLACASDLPHDEQKQVIRTSAGLAAVEYGHGMILGPLIDKNDDLADLREHHPSLATEYDDLRQQAFEASILSRKATAESNLRRRRAEELRKNADQGPIIIVNVTDLRSDALIVTLDAVTCVPLPAMDMTTTLLIRYSLDMSWIGSGAANGLPFHAAGSYRDDLDTNLPKSCLYCVASSYTPTIKALQYARLGAGNVDLTKKISLVLISMPTTPGHSDLPGVRAEKDAIKRAVGSYYDFTALEQSMAKEVLKHSQQAQLVHFACHGFADQINPSQSHLLLQKRSSDRKVAIDLLTVEALLDVKGQGN
ncbi:hypothetical protein HG530_008017 [Fusarium avenaceum]|nr:hypothetical protein HG530_008017 [Fusarium avenaceum]